MVRYKEEDRIEWKDFFVDPLFNKRIYKNFNDNDN